MTLQTSITEATTTEAHVVNEGDYQRLYEESRAENERLQTVMTSARMNGVPSTTGATNYSKGAATRVRAVVGEHQFQKMSRAERLTSIGADPTLSDQFLSRVFGRGNDGSIGRDLFKTDKARYDLLREASIILNLYAR